MLSGYGSLSRRRGRNNRTMRIAVPLGIATALGVTLGLILVPSGGKAAKVAPSAASAGVSSSAVNPNCDIIVPANPLSARGLATPYQLTGPAGRRPRPLGAR